ncbi:MAG: outer membrane beta-barrel protein [Bacteroidota bacterium]|nr:outer membrane beta-barrel protein [Bacteroidota bacterium]MEE3036933.1 outer membrane beta-barrel protein [Bacteroidota bacterium]
MIKVLFVLLSLYPFLLLAQDSDSPFSFGLQYKPIITAAYFNAGDEDVIWDNNEASLSPKFGQSFGMILRYQINNTFSLETGLNLVNRKYELSITNRIISLQDQANVNLRSYDWPIQILSYVRVAENYYLNASFGNAITIFPSDIISYGKKYDYFLVSTARRRKIQSALIANLGVEYRTKNKGIYYIGASLHRSWKTSARSFPEYDDGSNKFNTQAPTGESSKFFDINGNYFTIDLRYFFNGN